MRTTVDLDLGLLETARRLALKERRTLGAVLSDALTAYLGVRRQAAKEPPFELLVRGKPEGRFPTPADIAALEDTEDAASLRLPVRRPRASS